MGAGGVKELGTDLAVCKLLHDTNVNDNNMDMIERVLHEFLKNALSR